MYRRSTVWIALMLVIVLVPNGAAQPGQGTVAITFEPDQVAVPVGGHRNVTIHVEGTIECVPAFAGPTKPIQVSGKHGASRGAATGDIYRFEPMPVHVNWTAASDNRYRIEEAITVRVVSEVHPPGVGHYNATYWTTGTGSSDGCTPSGYDVPNAAPATLAIRIHHPAETDPAEASFTAVPLTILLLGFTAFLRRR